MTPPASPAPAPQVKRPHGLPALILVSRRFPAIPRQARTFPPPPHASQPWKRARKTHHLPSRHPALPAPFQFREPQPVILLPGRHPQFVSACLRQKYSQFRSSFTNQTRPRGNSQHRTFLHRPFPQPPRPDVHDHLHSIYLATQGFLNNPPHQPKSTALFSPVARPNPTPQTTYAKLNGLHPDLAQAKSPQ